MPGKADSSAFGAAIAKIGQAAKYKAELLVELNEIVTGQAFKGSPRSQAFLKHVVHLALQGNAEELRERSIGIALFERAADYDTADDAIVRVTASDVRKRLLQHYGSSGAGSKFRISLPSGSYLPEFSVFTTPRPTLPDSHPTDHPVHDPDAPVPPAPGSAPHSRSRRTVIIWIASATLFVVFVSWMLIGYGQGGAGNKGSLVLSAFLDKPQSVQVVVADDALVLIQVLLDRRFTLEEYENSTYLQLPELVQKKELQRFWGSLSKRQITNVGDLNNAMRIVDHLRSNSLDVTVRLARQMHARTFRSGNFVILGSSLSNPWAALFPVKETNFPFDELPRPGLPEVILNRTPLKGEPARYVAHRDPQTRAQITYAKVSLVENLTATGRVLLVAGQSMSATEMAGEFLLREESLEKVRNLLSLPVRGALPDLEMIIQVSEQNETGDRVALVAARRIAHGTE
jgi:hypothetical protein